MTVSNPLETFIHTAVQSTIQEKGTKSDSSNNSKSQVEPYVQHIFEIENIQDDSNEYFSADSENRFFSAPQSVQSDYDEAVDFESL